MQVVVTRVLFLFIYLFIHWIGYLDNNGTAKGLEHQRRVLKDREEEDLEASGSRKGVILQPPTATKYRKGACENCGSMTHKVKDCLERPRKTGAKYTGRDIRPDELVLSGGDGNSSSSSKRSFDAKRDRWVGYDTSQHMEIAQEWELVEEERKKLKEKEIEDRLSRKKQEEDGADDGLANALTKGDDDAYADEEDMPGQKVDLKTRMTIRNLRLREDTAKYLRNLDPNSSQIYDPKTRSMRDDPNAKKKVEFTI